MARQEKTTGLTIADAAEELGTTVPALWQRIHRARTETDTDHEGTSVELGHGVVAFMPVFRNVWTIYIPDRMLRALRQHRRKHGSVR